MSESQSPDFKAIFNGMTIVLVAHDLNMTIFKPVWMCKFDILRPDEITEGAFISPAAIQLPNPNFQVTILPNRLQMGFPTLNAEENSTLANRVLGGILKQLPHTPISAVGVNFEFLVHPTDLPTFGGWNKEKFATPLASKLVGGDGSQPRFGSYVSMYVGDIRLKLDMKPVRAMEDPRAETEALAPQTELMKLNFNYHLDLNHEDPTGHALAHLNRVPECIGHAKAIVDTLLTQ